MSIQKALLSIHKARKYEKENKYLQNVLSYYIGKRDFETALRIITSANEITSDEKLRYRFSKLFLNNMHATDYYGLGSSIVNTMSNMIFGGNVTIEVKDKEAQKLIDELYYDGYFMDSINEAYKASASTDGKAYLFMNTTQTYNKVTNVKVGEEFIDYKVFPSFEIEVYGNELIRTFYKDFEIKSEIHTFKFTYSYYTETNLKTTLYINGYDNKDLEISQELTKTILGIDELVFEYDYVPYLELNIERGMLPNIIFIEDSLAENIYFQNTDLSNSQTHTYIPEQFLYTSPLANHNSNYNDKYITSHMIKDGGLDAQQIVSVKGESAINDIEKNMIINIIRGCLDAGISPLSLGSSLIDKVANNTDVGIQKERVSIRLREKHIDRLKIFIAFAIKDYLYINGYNISVKDISVIFAQYITPSIETQTNVLAKQVQFGIKSNEQAVRELNRDELSDAEVEAEVERIKEFTTQRDFNVTQNLNKEKPKGVDNNLKSSGIVE